MAQQTKSDIELFKSGGQVYYDVSYLGNGPVEDTIPNHILRKKMYITGKLYFSLKEVKFEVNWNFEEDEEEEEYLFTFSMDELEGEKACHENKILIITLLPSHGNGESRRYYFDVSEDGEKGRAVYHPQWIKFAKRHNEQLEKEAL